MNTYITINFVMLTLILSLVYVIDSGFFNKRWFVALLFMLLLTAIFDSIIISQQIVDYNTDQILSLYLFRAPVEDFAYTIAGMLLVPLFWRMFNKWRPRGNS